MALRTTRLAPIGTLGDLNHALIEFLPIFHYCNGRLLLFPVPEARGDADREGVCSRGEG
jgi:hypothetical protein